MKRFYDTGPICGDDNTTTGIEAVAGEGSIYLFGICWIDVMKRTLNVDHLFNGDQDVIAHELEHTEAVEVMKFTQSNSELYNWIIVVLHESQRKMKERG